ncbi:protein phosphatase 2C 57 isoform X1 [Andrographis paniculata]|uniref:protein phosphatase 2C 57 isoform X1 n=1 Tax=Andrographis paniculata TaxID=175694 RepID=UPI0021E86952|nr:protein phosphatase 2C 57 isoform X1 [Andrographis paniculata]
MALCSPQLHKFLQGRICCNRGCNRTSTRKRMSSRVKGGEGQISCSAIAIDAPSSLTSVSGIRWGSAQLKGAREEMEDDSVIIQSDELDGFSYAAVFDGHAGFSSVKFLKEELYRECAAALKGGQVLDGKEFQAIKKALREAFESADAKLLKWLEESGEEAESGSTATVIFVRSDMMIVSHVGDSCVALSCAGKAQVLTGSHRPYGNNKVALQEIRRILEAGGWVCWSKRSPLLIIRSWQHFNCSASFVSLIYSAHLPGVCLIAINSCVQINNGRICGDISVSRSFGDMRFKTKKNEMLKKGVEEGRWTEKFASRIQPKGDWVTASPDVFQVALGPDAEFVVLASDGLWDYINSSDAVIFVRNHLRQHGDVQMASEALAQLALNRYSQDNISIVIADLGQTDWQSLPVQQQQQNVVLELGQAVATLSLVSLGIWAFTLFSS